MLRIIANKINTPKRWRSEKLVWVLFKFQIARQPIIFMQSPCPINATIPFPCSICQFITVVIFPPRTMFNVQCSMFPCKWYHFVTCSLGISPNIFSLGCGNPALALRVSAGFDSIGSQNTHKILFLIKHLILQGKYCIVTLVILIKEFKKTTSDKAISYHHDLQNICQVSWKKFRNE